MLKPTAAAAKTQTENMIIPAPVGGLNVTSSIMGMGKYDALVLNNFVPYPDRLELRDGVADHCTDFAKTIKQLWPYSAPTGGEKLFATTDDGVFDATAAGAVGTVKIALTNGQTIAVTCSTGASNYLLVVNGTDTMKQYDGTNWSSVATLGGTATSNYSYVELYRQRLFFIKKNSLIVDYLETNSISGTPTSFSLGAIFRRGGYLVALGTWTLDAGNGPEDRFVAITSEGEVGVYIGYDPSTLATWDFVGVYYIGKPLGPRCLFKYSGDLLYLSEAGLFPLSKALMVAAIDKTQAISGKIQPLFSGAARDYAAQSGWQVISQPNIPLILVNVPATKASYQFVMHSQTGAWATFTGIDAESMARMGDTLFFAIGTKVAKMTGKNDFGANITGSFLSGYKRMGGGKQALVKSIKPYIQTTGKFDYYLGFSQEFNQSVSPTHIYPHGWADSSYIWGTDRFGEAYWSGGTNYENGWQTAPDIYSPWKAIYFRARSNTADLAYIGSELLLKLGGNF